jgi:hypothetical protein
MGRAIAEAVAPLGRWSAFLATTTGEEENAEAKLNRPKILSATVDGERTLHVTMRDPVLPLPLTPLDDASATTWERGKVIAPLKRGQSFTLRHGETTLATAIATEWARGVEVERSYSEKRVRDLQAAIQLKNFLFFQRHRPQNETYLFLFRKHEQGNNAVEIPHAVRPADRADGSGDRETGDAGGDGSGTDARKVIFPPSVPRTERTNVACSARPSQAESSRRRSSFCRCSSRSRLLARRSIASPSRRWSSRRRF